MDNKTAKTISVILGALGIIFILIMAFDLLPGKGNIMLFVGVACFIIAGVIRNIVKIQGKK